MASKSHNPERKTWKGVSYKKGGKRVKAARRSILENACAFNSNFLQAHMPDINLDDVDLDQIIYKSCDLANSFVLKLIEDHDHFVDDAITSDGCGHFLAWYDGDEIELSNDFFAYRVE